MKKIISLCVVVVFLVGLSSCSAAKNQSSTSSEDSQEVMESSLDSSKPIESDEDSSKPIESDEDSSSQPSSKAGAASDSKNSSIPTPTSLAQTSSTTPPLQTVRVTFPEGTTVSKMFDILDEKGVAKQADLFAMIETDTFSSYSLVNSIVPSSARCFKLEGYLFPNTYDFYNGEKPQDVIGKLLKVTEKKITQEYRNRANELGYSMDEILTLASIIQKEAFSATEMAKVSSVFHNRLKIKQRLQSDVTIKYVEGAIKPYITGDINRYNSYYNTYKCSALPAGPICNPGIAAIKAALYPADTDYYFFVTDASGNYYYASTHDEHVANCVTAGVTVVN